VKFSPTKPDEYNAALNAKLQAGTAGDIITCRPFDAGQLPYTNSTGRHHRPEGLNTSATSPKRLITDDGKVVYCVPIASVLHGFIYNKDY
jgi:raffinose/stachyose/melibiose transport system substrate-binding protein